MQCQWPTLGRISSFFCSSVHPQLLSCQLMGSTEAYGLSAHLSLIWVQLASGLVLSSAPAITSSGHLIWAYCGGSAPAIIRHSEM